MLIQSQPVQFGWSFFLPDRVIRMGEGWLGLFYAYGQWIRFICYYLLRSLFLFVDPYFFDPKLDKNLLNSTLYGISSSITSIPIIFIARLKVKLFSSNTNYNCLISTVIKGWEEFLQYINSMRQALSMIWVQYLQMALRVYLRWFECWGCQCQQLFSYDSNALYYY